MRAPLWTRAAGRNLLLLSVATSVDALAVGLSFAILGTPVWGPAFCIGLVCALVTACGVFLGKTLANICSLNAWAELLGGLTLLAIACNIRGSTAPSAEALLRPSRRSMVSSTDGGIVMATVSATYLGDLRVECVHNQSGTRIITDAPTDNQGKGSVLFAHGPLRHSPWGPAP